MTWEVRTTVTPVLVASRILQRDAALLQLRSVAGHELGDFIETRGGFGDAAAPEIRDGFVEDRFRIVVGLLRGGRESNQT